MTIPANPKPPKRIFLQWHGDAIGYERGPVAEHEVSWSQEQIFPRDIEYVRKTQLDAARRQIARYKKHITDLQRHYDLLAEVNAKVCQTFTTTPKE